MYFPFHNYSLRESHQRSRPEKEEFSNAVKRKLSCLPKLVISIKLFFDENTSGVFERRHCRGCERCQGGDTSFHSNMGQAEYNKLGWIAPRKSFFGYDVTGLIENCYCSIPNPRIIPMLLARWRSWDFIFPTILYRSDGIRTHVSQ